MVGIERHGFLLINVFARLDRGHEVERMLVLRSRDEDGIDGLVVEQASEIAVGLDFRRDGLRFVQAPSIDISHRHGLDIRAAPRRSENLFAAAAGSDQADADAIIGAPNAPGYSYSGDGYPGGSASQLLQECAAIRHKSPHDIRSCAPEYSRQGLMTSADHTPQNSEPGKR